jgi:RHS repeat-associated protein
VDGGFCSVCTATRLNPAERREYAFGSGAAGPLVRKTDYTYLHTNNQQYITRNIVNRVKLVSVYDGSGVLKSQTQNDYDIYNYSDMGSMLPSNAVQHDATNYGTTFIYRGNVTATKKWRNTDGAWLESRRQYDDAGNTLKTRDPLSHFTNFDYTDNWANSVCAAAGQAKGYIKSVTNALNQSTVRSFNSCTGTVAASTDPNNQTTAFSYDFRDRPDIASFPDGGQVDNDYDETNRVVTVKKTITAAATIYSKVTYDLLGRATKSQLCEDGMASCAASIKTDTTYDAFGRVATVSNPYRTANDPGPTNGVTMNQYDALDRIAILVPPDGTVSTNNVSTLYTGNCSTVTDQAGKKRKSCSDSLGRLIQVFEPDSGGNLIYETDYQYDTLDNLTRVDQKGNDANSANWRTRTFAYNSLSLLTSATNPESGPAASAGTITYAYNNDSVLISKTDPRGITVNYNPAESPIDPLHRITKKTYSNNDPAVSYFYDQTTYNGLTIANGIGRRTGMSDAAGAEAWSFDAMGRTLVDRRSTNAITKNTSYTYNLDGSLATLTYPGSRVVIYTSDAAGRPILAHDQGLNIDYAWGTCGPSSNGVCYSPSGAMSYMKNGTLFNSTYLYNKRVQPCWTWVHTTNAGAPATCAQAGVTTAALLDFQYDFGLGTADNGNVNRTVNRRNLGRSITYQYDELNRIKSAITDATSGTFCWGQLFGSMSGSTYVSGYDSWANLKTITPDPSRPACATAALSKTINAYNKVIDSGFGYDSAGNMTAQPGLTSAFNAENQMTSAAGVTYTYDGDGKRVKKSNGKLYWYGTGSDPLSESDLSGNVTDAYIFFNGKRIARQTSSGNGVPFFYFSDHLGTTRAIAQAGVSSACYDADFYPFGVEAAIATNSCPTNYKFTGKERDSESGLDNFGARYFSNSTARFTAADPHLTDSQRMRDPQQLNMYSYARNNPLRFGDDDGQDVKETIVQKPYTVHGSTASAAVANAQQTSGFKSETGEAMTAETNASMRVVYKDVSVEVTPGTEATGSTAFLEVKSADVILKQTITMPTWAERDSASPGEQQAWDQGVAKLQKHEEGHAEINRQSAQQLDKQIPGTTGYGTGKTPGEAQQKANNQMNNKVRKELQQNVNQTKNKQREYDKKTDHGRNQP